MAWTNINEIQINKWEDVLTKKKKKDGEGEKDNDKHKKIDIRKTVHWQNILEKHTICMIDKETKMAFHWEKCLFSTVYRFNRLIRYAFVCRQQQQQLISLSFCYWLSMAIVIVKHWRISANNCRTHTLTFGHVSHYLAYNYANHLMKTLAFAIVKREKCLYGKQRMRKWKAAGEKGDMESESKEYLFTREKFI